MQLIRIVSGSKPNEAVSIGMTEQIAAIWFLLEYKEYHHITLKILDNPDLEKMANERWNKFVLPQVRLLTEEIKLK